MRFFKSKKRAVLFAFAALLCVVLFSALWAFLIEPNRVVVNEVEIKLPAWPAAFANLKIVAISDLHAGMPFINEAKLQQVVSMANQTQPDLIVLLGDFIARDRRDERLLMTPEMIAENLKGLHAKYGVYAILGNHDWNFDGERVRRALEGTGHTCARK